MRYSAPAQSGIAGADLSSTPLGTPLKPTATGFVPVDADTDPVYCYLVSQANTSDVGQAIAFVTYGEVEVPSNGAIAAGANCIPHSSGAVQSMGAVSAAKNAVRCLIAKEAAANNRVYGRIV